MGKEWTQERRRAAAERIRKNKPWKKSTGPRTEEYKVHSKMNAWKHGIRSSLINELREVLRLHRSFLKTAKKLYVQDSHLLEMGKTSS